MNYIIDMKKINNITNLDKKTLIERGLKLTEELGEVSNSIVEYIKSEKQGNIENLIEENIDTLLISLSIICQVYTQEKYSNPVLNFKDNNENIGKNMLLLTKSVGGVSESILSVSKVNGCSYKNKTLEDIVSQCEQVILYSSRMIGIVVNKHNLTLEFVVDILNSKIIKWKNKSTNK